MKYLHLAVIFSLAVIQPLVQPQFIAPLAIGAAIGAVALAKGLIIGGLLARGRSRQTNTNQGRSYRTYTPSRHQNYGHSYAKPSRSYYYSSNRNHRRGKRFAPEELPTVQEMERYKREIANGIHDDNFWLEMLEKDQDDCFKMLLCQTFAKARPETEVESVLREVFGEGDIKVDVSKATALFDMAALTGARGGLDKCHKFYKRCDTPVPAMLEMIETELKEFEELSKDLETRRDAKGELEKKMKEEKDEMTTTLISEKIITDEAQIWT